MILAHYAFATTLIILVVIERMLNATAMLVVRLVFGTSSEDDDASSNLKGYAGTQLVGAGFTFGANLFASLGASFSGTVSAIASYAIWMVLSFAIFAMLFVIQEQYPALMINVVDSWNDTYGALIYEVVFFPLQIVNLVFTSVIPIYNGVLWIGKLIVHNLVIRSAIENIDNLVDIGKNVANLSQHLILQIPDYFQAVIVPCAKPVTDSCYDPGFGNRIFDMITPMADVRAIAAATLKICISICANAAGPFDIALYPLLDINLAKAVHNLVNFVLYTLLHLPSVTVQRCFNNNHDLIMCLPDFEPSFNLLVAGIRNLGMLVDNWLDVSSIIVQKSLGLDPKAECEAQAMLLSPASYSRAVFGQNRTTVVGLTPGLYAVTDGTHAQYFNHYDSIESTILPNAFPIDVDVRFGIAAVTYTAQQRDGATGQSSTTMMGCRCLDNDGRPPMRIQCALALKERISLTNSQANVFDVIFQQRSTADYMMCSMAQISVQSIRWPATRFVSTEASPDRVYTATTRSVVDATIWVSPLCTSRAGRVPEVCTSIFTGAACYPYCMAARLQGSGANGLVLYNANEWRDRVHLMHRDCNREQQDYSPSDAKLLTSGTETKEQFDAKTTVETTSENSAEVIKGSSVVVEKWDTVTSRCVPAAMSRTLMGKEIYQTVSKRNVFRSVLLPGQPFAYAGDVTLTAVQLNSGEYAVAVDRLYGSENNEFTMVNVLKEFPANPPAETQKMEGKRIEIVDRLPIPYSFSDMAAVQHPSVSTRTSVFFAVNPSLAMFK
jgi:hypothetical protein